LRLAHGGKAWCDPHFPPDEELSMPAQSTARARWTGALLTGTGTTTTDSPALQETPLTWKARIGEEAGTTPEELMASAHAACFSMALSGALAKSGHEPDHLDTTATYTFGPVATGGFAIQHVAIVVEGVVPGIDEAEFVELAEGTQHGCPVSKALHPDLPVSLDAKLLQHA
jgi:osmotically inducible protein OsmC